MRTFLSLLTLTFAVAPVLSAAEPVPPCSNPLLEEHFEAPTLPPAWKPGGRPNSFTIVDGALQGAAAPDDGHGPSISVPLAGENFKVAFRMRFVKNGYFLFMLDGETPFGEVDHLLRFVLTDSQAQLAQDCGTLQSKRDQLAAAAKVGKRFLPGTKEQLADPKFHRTEILAKETTKIAAPGWHDIVIEQQGNQVQAHIDNQLHLNATGTVVAGKKLRLVFLIGNSGTMQVDDVRVWELPK